MMFRDRGLNVYHHIDHEPQSNCPMHTHDYIELYYFISGDCLCLVEGTEYRLKPRDILIIRPFEAHTMRWFSNRPYERIGFQFPVKLLKEADPDGGIYAHLMARPLGTENRFTDADFGHTFCADCLQSMTPEISRAGVLARALLLLTEAKRVSQGRGNGYRSTGLEARIIDFVNQKLFSPLTAEEVSREFFISRSQINRIFKKYTGSSLGQYITAKRMTTARSRIHNGEPAMLVAAECGYTDYSAFYRAYIKFFGASPKKDL